MIKDGNGISRDIEKAYNNKKYIVSYRTVYQPFYSVNAGYYAQAVYTQRHTDDLPLVKRGRFVHLTGKEVNHIIGYNLLFDL